MNTTNKVNFQEQEKRGRGPILYSMTEEKASKVGKELTRYLLPVTPDCETVQAVRLAFDGKYMHLREEYKDMEPNENVVRTIVVVTDELVTHLVYIAKAYFGIAELEEAYSSNSDYFEFYNKELDSNGTLVVKGSTLEITKPVASKDILFTLTKAQLSALLYDILESAPTVRLEHGLTCLSYTERTSKKARRPKELADQLVQTVENMEWSEKAELVLAVLNNADITDLLDTIVCTANIGLDYDDFGAHDFTSSDFQDVFTELFELFTPIYAELLRSGGNQNESN